jgi:hypothetical protein
MADRPTLDWSEWNKATPQPYQPNPYSTVDSFKKEQITAVNDGTKVGKIEGAILPKVAQGIETAKKVPVLGGLVNPALTLMETITRNVIQPVTQGVSTAVLTGEALAQGYGAKSFRFAKEQAKKVSMGQAIAGSLGQTVGSILPDAVTPTFMDSDFNIFNEEQRNRAFRDEWAGIVASGATDLVAAALGTKGLGKVVRTGATAATGSKVIKTEAQMEQFRQKAQEAVEWANRADGTAAPSGLAALIDDAVKQTNVSKLTANPLVRETSNPGRTATILSRLDNHQDVSDYLLAERGDVAAFTRFFERRPLDGDHLDNYGINTADPISDFSGITLQTLDPKLTKRYQKIINAKKKEDRGFADALDDFLSKTTSKEGAIIESYQPGKYSPLVGLELKKNKLFDQAKYGDLKLLGKDGDNGWRTTVYQSKPYDRAIRVIAWVGSGRPQGYINISNPRRFEAANDLLSDLNRLQMLKGAEGTKFKRDMVEKYIQAQTDTDRAMVLAEVEQQVMVKLAKFYGVRGIEDIRTSDDAVAQITKWHVGTSERRQSLRQYAEQNGFIPDEEGNLNVTNFIAQSNEAQSLPMLDFRRLETEVILNTKRALGKSAPITKGQVGGAIAARGGMALGQFLDLANMAFNNLNLLRFAYIPKNSMVDPFARASMALESTELLRNALPGVQNIAYNSSLRLRRASSLIPGMPSAKVRRAEKSAKKQMSLLAADLKEAVIPWEKAQKTYDDALSLIETAKRNQTKAAARLAKANSKNKADLTAAKQKADDDLRKAEDDLIDAELELNNRGQIVQGVSMLIEKNREALVTSATRRNDLKEYKRLGQESEVIVVNGKEYSIAGLADPNIRGANPYMLEVDSATNFYSAALNSEISRRISAQGGRFVKISRNEGKPYWNALAHIANRQIRQELDMPLGMMMRGDSDAAIMNWLYKTESGSEYLRRLSARMGYRKDANGKLIREDLSKDQVRAWVSDTKDKVLRMFPSEELREVILQRNVGIDEVEAMLRNRTDLLDTIDGPNIALNDLNKAERMFARLSGTQDAAWRILSATENRMVRNPLFLSYTRDEMKVLINAAQRAGIDPSDAFVNNQIRQVAYRNALRRVEQTLYSSRRLTNGMYAARYAMSFPLAFFNSQMVASRLMLRNPANAYWYDSIANAFDTFEAYEDKDGNTYKSMADVPKGTQVFVTYPMPFGDKLPKWAKDALKPYTDSRGGGVKWNPKQMEFMVADPSVSWFGTVGISELIKNGFTAPGGLWTVHGEDVAKSLQDTFGEDFYKNSILYGGYPQEGDSLVGTALNTIAPGYLRSIMDRYNILRSDRFTDEVLTNYRVLFSEWDRNGRVGEVPSMETAAKAAGNMSFIRSVVQFFAPISTTFDPVTRAATQYYSELVDANGGDYEKAEKQFVAEYGVDGLALIGSNRKNIAGVASNFSDIKMLRNNPELLKKVGGYNTKYAQMLSVGYGDLTDEYSPEIAAIYKRLDFPGAFDNPISQKKTPAELAIDVQARRGWYEYNKAVEWRDAMMYQYGIKSASEIRYQSTGIKDEFDAMVRQMAADYKGWVDDRSNGRKDFWNATVPAIKEVINDQAWMNHAAKTNSKWEEIAFWLSQAEQFKAEYDNTMNSRQRKDDLKRNFSQFHYQYMQESSDEFGAFASRWLETMPELNIELVVD